MNVKQVAQNSLFALLTSHIYSNTVQKTFTFTWKRPELYQNIFKGTELQYFGQRSLCTEGSWGQVASSSWIFKLVAFLCMGKPSMWIFIKAQTRGSKIPGFLSLLFKPWITSLIGFAISWWQPFEFVLYWDLSEVHQWQKIKPRAC